jgi:hypothetical protein
MTICKGTPSVRLVVSKRWSSDHTITTGTPRSNDLLCVASVVILVDRHLFGTLSLSSLTPSFLHTGLFGLGSSKVVGHQRSDQEGCFQGVGRIVGCFNAVLSLGI